MLDLIGRIIGALIILSFFAGLFVLAVITVGFAKALMVFGLTAATVLFLGLGVYLLTR